MTQGQDVGSEGESEEGSEDDGDVGSDKRRGIGMRTFQQREDDDSSEDEREQRNTGMCTIQDS